VVVFFLQIKTIHNYLFQPRGPYSSLRLFYLWTRHTGVPPSSNISLTCGVTRTAGSTNASIVACGGARTHRRMRVLGKHHVLFSCLGTRPLEPRSSKSLPHTSSSSSVTAKRGRTGHTNPQFPTSMLMLISTIVLHSHAPLTHIFQMGGAMDLDSGVSNFGARLVN
jgi:hypothetical protein